MLANFSNLITFSRGSNATVTDASGRLTYAASNILTNSQDFESANWTKNGVTVAANAVAAPDGTLTADTAIADAILATHRVSQTPTVANGVQYIASIYVKAAGYSKVAIREGNISGAYAAFDLSTGALLEQGSGGTGTISNVGNGWYRISMRSTSGGTAMRIDLIIVDPAYTTGAPNLGWTGNGTSGIYFWGAQLEAVTYQTTPSPYVSTSVANLLGFSEDFANAAWTKQRASIVPNAAQNPINNLWNAQKLMEDTTASNTHRLFGSITTTAIPYTLSVYMKAGERNWAYLRLDRSGGTTAVAWFNLSTGAVGTVQTGLTASIQSVGNGWYRCSATIDAAVAGAGNPLIGVTTANGTESYTGDGNSGIYIYGAQLSNSGSLDPYVPTPGAAPSSTAYYGPRFDYDPVTLAAKGILIEEQRTNVFTYSNTFSDVSWTKINLSVAASDVVSPAGTTDASTFTGTSTITSTYILKSAPSANTYTMSFYVRARSLSTFRMQVSSSGNGIFCLYDLITGTPGTPTVLGTGGTVSSASATMTAVGNGWYRCTFTFVQSSTNFVFLLMDTGTLDVYGAQLEAGAFATSYIPTVASQVTRSADVASITGSLFSQWYRQDEGTFVVQFDDTSVGASYFTNVYRVDDGTANNRMALYRNASPTSVGFDVTTGGASQVNAVTATASIANPTKHAATYKANDFAASVNGGTVATDTSGTVPSGISVLRLGRDTTGLATTILNGHIQNITYIPNAVSASQLQSATS